MILHNHNIIAWDFDGTLIGIEGGYLLRQFVAQNQHKEHHIITMRSHGQERDIQEILDANGLSVSAFKSIINLPDKIYECYYDTMDAGKPVETHEYNIWKAKKCLEINATILIDDMEGDKVSRYGCDLNNIEIIHPKTLIDILVGQHDGSMQC